LKQISEPGYVLVRDQNLVHIKFQNPKKVENIQILQHFFECFHENKMGMNKVFKKKLLNSRC